MLQNLYGKLNDRFGTTITNPRSLTSFKKIRQQS